MDKKISNQRFDKGIGFFNSGKYHEAHDEWEVIWKGLPESTEKILFKGLIMAAAALHHYKRKEYAGTSKLLKRVTEILGNLKGLAANIDIEAFLADISLFSERFESSEEIPEGEFPKIKILR